MLNKSFECVWLSTTKNESFEKQLIVWKRDLKNINKRKKWEEVMQEISKLWNISNKLMTNMIEEMTNSMGPSNGKKRWNSRRLR